MFFKNKRMILITAVCGFAVLSSCRESEQDRPLVKEKGVYEGPADAKLSDATLHKLRHRSARQGF